MSEDLLATFITLVILAAVFTWVPLLKLVCPPCSRYLKSRRRCLPIARLTTLPSNREAA